jgi:methionine biosynthesis protein MetW
VTRSLPYSWYDTPNIHFCTIRDFVELCGEVNATIDQSMVLHHSGEKSVSIGSRLWFWNLFGQQAVFLLRR